MNINSIKKAGRKFLLPSMVFLGLVSCYDNGFDEFVPPTGNVNNIQPNTLFTTSTDASDNLGLVFRSFSTDAVSYLWDFGDGSTSTDANPNYTYAEGGLYNVKLTTTSSDGLIAVDSSEVAPISVDFDFTTVDSEVIFENFTSGAQSLSWDFGDGSEPVEWNVEDTEEDQDFNPSYIYRTADVFEATLTATTFLGNQVSVTKNIEGLILSTVPDFTFVVSDNDVSFTDASLLAVSHSWDFGDGNTSTDVNPMNTYASDGSYDVTLTTTNEAGISKSKTQTIAIGGIPATRAAVVLSGDFDKDSENIQNPWAVNPDNSSAFDFWDNIALEGVVQALPGGSDKGSSSGTSNLTPGSLKLDADSKRAYQPINIEFGVEYTINAFVKNKSAAAGDVVGTFYVLSYEPADETVILTDNLAAIPVVASSTGAWDEVTIPFTASSTFSFDEDSVTLDAGDILTSVDQEWIVLYFVPDLTTAAEVNLDDVSIITPGF